jgi:NitT/TauT family transport system permease protein
VEKRGNAGILVRSLQTAKLAVRLPRPALAPIFILRFGVGAASKITVAASIVFFVLLVNIMAGIHSVNHVIAFLSRLLGMSKWQIFRLGFVRLSTAGAGEGDVVSSCC